MKRVFTDTVVRNMYDDYGHLGKDVLEMVMHTSKIEKVIIEQQVIANGYGGKAFYGGKVELFKAMKDKYYILQPPKNVLEAYENMGTDIPKEFVIRTGEDKVICKLVCK